MATTFEKKCFILAEIWMLYRQDEAFADFIEYNDLGLPLAYLLDNGIVQKTAKAEQFVNEAFDLLLAGFAFEDKGFESLTEILDLSEEE